MKNTFGQSVTVTLFGESHGPAVGAVVDGLCPGLPVSDEAIQNLLSRRRPSSALDTARREPDNYQIVSGVWNGKTTGTPMCILIPNENVKSNDYIYGKARPSHADYAAYRKYHGYEDYRGGGHFSGRVTAALTAVGGILIPALEALGITFATRIKTCGGISDREYRDYISDVAALKVSEFPMLDNRAAWKVSEKILEARENKDSIGGLTQTVICGVPAGFGEPWFDSVESMLSHAMFSIGGIKGIEFGLGFGFGRAHGSEANDAFTVEDEKIITVTNNNGGINGGITNGMPILFSCAVKPTPSIAQAQNTVDFLRNENTQLEITGRHDPAIIRRICPVIDSMTAIVLYDMLAARLGTDFALKGELL